MFPEHSGDQKIVSMDTQYVKALKYEKIISEISWIIYKKMCHSFTKSLKTVIV